MKKFFLLFFSYLFFLISFFIYTFTQVDLSLTLSQNSIYQSIQKSLQYVGYFQRPTSAIIFTFLIILAFVFYLIFIYLAKKNLLSLKNIWILVFITFGVLVFSYNAFSYDLFNYIFDAKIISHYNQNPYIQKALDFPNDPMLSFMHWTHRTYPYGPFWLLLTVPLSYLSFNFFLPSFFIFKFVIGLSFLGTSYFIAKIAKIIFPGDERFALVFFALNPLIYVETLISSHNDLPMIFFAIFALYIIIKKSFLNSVALFLFSIGIKFATAFMLPIYLFVLFKIFKNKKIKWKNIFILISLLMLLSTIFASIRTNFQPWYLIFFIPFVSFLGKKYYFSIPVFVLSIFALFNYLPYIYFGHWNNPVPQILYLLQVISIGLSLFLVLVTFLLKHLYKR